MDWDSRVSMYLIIVGLVRDDDSDDLLDLFNFTLVNLKKRPQATDSVSYDMSSSSITTVVVATK